MKRFTLFCILASLFCTGLSAQDIRDQYPTKAEACADASYQDCDEYYTYGQIGWEKRVGWRPILYLDQYETDHRAYNVNMTMFVQVACEGNMLSDCEIVAVNSEGKVVGNQCPEPFPDGYGKRHECTDVASMAVFGASGDKIRFKIVTGSTLDELQEEWAEEEYTFSANSVVGLSDTDGDGRPDTLEPFVLHLTLPGDVNRDGKFSIVDVAGTVSILKGDAAPGMSEQAADFNGHDGVNLDDVQDLVDHILQRGKE